MISAALAILETESERNQLSEIYENNIKKFYSIAYSKLHNQHDAEDAIQEAFLSVARNASTFFNIPDEKRVSYINVIIRNISYKLWNKKHKIEENQTELDELIPDEKFSAEEKVLDDYSCGKILDFISTLPESLKSAMYLKINLGLKNAEIARTLEISEEAAKKRVTRAESQIRKYLKELKND